MPRPGQGRGTIPRIRAGRTTPSGCRAGRGCEKGPGGRADARGAVVPEDGEPAVRPVRARVVHVYRAAVAQHQIGFPYHPPSLKAVALLHPPKFAELAFPDVG